MKEKPIVFGYEFLCLIKCKHTMVDIKHVFRTKDEAVDYRLHISTLIKYSINSNHFPLIEIENNIISSDSIECISFYIQQITVNDNTTFDTKEDILCEFQQK